MKNEKDLGLVEPNIELVHDIGEYTVNDAVIIYYNKSKLGFEDIDTVVKDCKQKSMVISKTLEVLSDKFKENIII